MEAPFLAWMAVPAAFSSAESHSPCDLREGTRLPPPPSFLCSCVVSFDVLTVSLSLSRSDNNGEQCLLCTSLSLSISLSSLSVFLSQRGSLYCDVFERVMPRGMGWDSSSGDSVGCRDRDHHQHLQWEPSTATDRQITWQGTVHI